jgi:hypothetical protein
MVLEDGQGGDPATSPGRTSTERLNLRGLENGTITVLDKHQQLGRL